MTAITGRRIISSARLRPKLERVADIDPAAFWDAILTHKPRGHSFRMISEELGISDSTFTRIRYAAEGIEPTYRPDLATYMSICWWMNREPGDFAVWPHGHGPDR
jgi:AraC-like DNA-binding protein